MAKRLNGAPMVALAAVLALAGCAEKRVACSALDLGRYAVLAPATGFHVTESETAHTRIAGDETAWLLFSPDDRRRILSAHWCDIYGATGAGRITLYDSRSGDPIAAVEAESYRVF